MARDRIYHVVRNALERDGWTIRDNPYVLVWQTDRILIDVGAERALLAEREDEYIAIEMKSFLGGSTLTDFYHALGQYQTYLIALRQLDPDRKLYLAVTEQAYNTLIRRPLIQLVLSHLPMSFVIVDIIIEEVIQWVP